MATGDVFADHYTAVVLAGIDIQPAAGVQVLISYITANDANTRIRFKNSTGTFDAFVPTGTTSDNSMPAGRMNQNMKLFLTNTEYINLGSSSATTRYVAYSGIEI